MKIAHTSDWHIGKKLMGRDRGDEFKSVLAEIADICAEEQALFRRLAERNAKNMCFAHYTIRFVSETEIETAVEEEVAGWKNS